MTSRQTWAIFCVTKIDVRQTALTDGEASALISALNTPATRDETIARIAALPGAVVKGKAAKPKQDWISCARFFIVFYLIGGQGVTSAGCPNL